MIQSLTKWKGEIWKKDASDNDPPSSAGYTDDVCKYLRDSVPKTMLADLKEFLSNGGSVNNKDKYGASIVSWFYFYRWSSDEFILQFCKHLC